MSSICMQNIGFIQLVVSERNVFKNGMKICLLYDIFDVLTFATYAFFLCFFFVFRLRSICSHLHYLDYHGLLCNCSRMID